MSQSKLKPYKKEKFILTDEDWYPSYTNNKVRVFILQYINEPIETAKWLVAVWGNDDFGLEKVFSCNEKVQAETLFNLICDYTTQQKLREFGMINA